MKIGLVYTIELDNLGRDNMKQFFRFNYFLKKSEDI